MVNFIFIIVWSYSQRYMQGDSIHRRFNYLLIVLAASINTVLLADNIFLLAFAWTLMNIILSQLMMHKSSWQAAVNSSRIMLRTTLTGCVFLYLGLLILFFNTGISSIHQLVLVDTTSPRIIAGLFCLIMTAIMQSAIWPFHRWLLSSLNSPTPVSAIMHAGIINAGGYLLIRFSPVFLNHLHLLQMIFIIGLITALLGTLFKLMQHDVKRLLACSTMAQMGYMIMQCGLGLFPAALVHLCWHSCFKAHLFLSASQVNRTTDKNQLHRFSIKQLPLAMVCGVVGTCIFALIVDGHWFALTTDIILLMVTMLFITQCSLSLKQHTSAFISLLIAIIIGASYAAMIRLLEDTVFSSLTIPMTTIYSIGAFVLLLSWFLQFIPSLMSHHRWWLKIYNVALSASQPLQSTKTLHRNHYHYL